MATAPIPRVLRRFFRQSVPDAVATELDFHLAMRAQELIDRGIAPDEAQRLAAARFANFQTIATECRPATSAARQTHHAPHRISAGIPRRYPVCAAPVPALARFHLRRRCHTRPRHRRHHDHLQRGREAVLLRRFDYANPARTMLVTETMMGEDGGVSAGKLRRLACRITLVR